MYTGGVGRTTHALAECAPSVWRTLARAGLMYQSTARDTCAARQLIHSTSRCAPLDSEPMARMQPWPSYYSRSALITIRISRARYFIPSRYEARRLAALYRAFACGGTLPASLASSTPRRLQCASSSCSLRLSLFSNRASRHHGSHRSAARRSFNTSSLLPDSLTRYQ